MLADEFCCNFLPYPSADLLPGALLGLSLREKGKYFIKFRVSQVSVLMPSIKV
jgi:hypothetical protein